MVAENRPPHGQQETFAATDPGGGTAARAGLDAFVAHARAAVEDALAAWLPPAAPTGSTLHEAMRYSVLAGGKRLRPVLCLLAARSSTPGRDATTTSRTAPDLAFPGSWLRVAAALELIHTYSLIHDDLPAMDDDDLRRGRPTNHKVYGEATAILAGDALLTLAFEWVAMATGGGESDAAGDGAGEPAPSAAAVVRLVHILATAAGHAGMVGGQALDMRFETEPATFDDLVAIHRGKTGALLAGAVEMGAALAGVSPAIIAPVRAFGQEIGLLFQITDDLLDVTGTAAELGKNPGVDVTRGKATYPGMLGIEAARAAAAASRQRAHALLAGWPGPTGLLHALVDWIHARTH